MRKRGTKNKVYSFEFKLMVVTQMLEQHLGYREAAIKFGISSKGANGKGIVKRWERIYLEEGEEGLKKKRRGKNTTGRPPKLDKAVEEDLIAEVQRLRLENAYLKKLHALALSRMESENKTKPE